MPGICCSKFPGAEKLSTPARPLCLRFEPPFRDRVAICGFIAVCFE
jgi:hypothetical protein